MSGEKYSVIARNISKCYKMYSGPKEKLMDLLSIKNAGKEFYALKNLTFEVEKGDVVGLLGLNGSGKSTLSNILGGVSIPSNGEIEINGEASLIAIGLGLNNFLTGIENIEVKALMMGYKKEEIEGIKQHVIEFAEIGDFINQPIRTYSSGMRARLGFAISVNMDPDILVIDEALSVGDPTFTQKCLDKMNEFKERGKTIFFVSHSTSQVKKFCNKALWLEYGILKDYGTIEEILPKYEEYIRTINKMTEEEKKLYKNQVLKGQEHSLLREFKVLDPKLKKVKLSGKIIKLASLVNKNNLVKVVPYKFDIFTMAFGFIPSILRKNIDISILIFLSQILNFFIVSMPYAIISNFIINSIWAAFTGKTYVNNLIENQFYLDEDLWIKRKEENQLEEIYKIKKVRKRKMKIISLGLILSLLYVSVVSTIAVGKIVTNYKNPILVEESFELEGKLLLLIVGKDSNNKKEVLKSIGVVRQEGDRLQMINYPATLQVNVNNYYYDTIANNYIENDISRIKDILRDNFNVDISKYLIINDEDFDTEVSAYKNDKDIYYALLNEIVRSDEGRYRNIKASLLEGNSSINEKFLDDLRQYLSRRGSRVEEKLVMTTINYKVAIIKDIVRMDILKKVGMEAFKDVKIYYIDKSHIEKNLLIKKIRSKHKYLKDKEQLEKIDIDEMLPEIEDDSYLWDTDWWIPDSSGSSTENDSSGDSNSEGSSGGNNNSGDGGGNDNSGSNDSILPNPPEEETPDEKPNPEPPVIDPEPPVVDPEPPVVDPEPPVVDPEVPVDPSIH